MCAELWKELAMSWLISVLSNLGIWSLIGIVLFVGCIIFWARMFYEEIMFNVRSKRNVDKDSK